MKLYQIYMIQQTVNINSNDNFLSLSKIDKIIVDLTLIEKKKNILHRSN